MKAKTSYRRSVTRLFLALTATVAAAAETPPATTIDARDLLDALVQKGLLNEQDAAALVQKTAAAKAARAASPQVAPSGAATTRLAIGGRVQAQFVALSADESPGNDPADTQHFLLRRIYLNARAELGPSLAGAFRYDMANSSFDLAVVQWKSPELGVDVGYRMVNFGREQRVSSGSLKAIERSAVTRYFVEDAAGANLGAGSYRVGVFAEGENGPWFWGAAVTNPESVATLADTKGPGSAGTNTPALWLNGGVRRKTDRTKLTLGLGLGLVPDQGGATTGKGDDVAVANAYADYAAGRLGLLAEVFAGEDQASAFDGGDARAFGGFVQPSWSFTPALEGVFRIGYLDTDGRGASLKNTVPGSPSTRLTDRVFDAYLGGNWYIRADSFKLQAGLIYARGEDTPSGAPLRTESIGVRSQLQVDF